MPDEKQRTLRVLERADFVKKITRFLRSFLRVPRAKFRGAERRAQQLEVAFAVELEPSERIFNYLVRRTCSWHHFALVPLQDEPYICKQLLDSRTEIFDKRFEKRNIQLTLQKNESSTNASE